MIRPLSCGSFRAGARVIFIRDSCRARAGLFARGTLPARRGGKLNRRECWRGSCSVFRTSHDSAAHRSLRGFDLLFWIELQIAAAGLWIDVAFENDKVSLARIKVYRKTGVSSVGEFREVGSRDI